MDSPVLSRDEELVGSAGGHLAVRNDLRVQQADEGFPQRKFLRPTGQIKLLCVRLPHGTAQVGLFWHARNEILWADGFGENFKLFPK